MPEPQQRQCKWLAKGRLVVAFRLQDPLGRYRYWTLRFWTPLSARSPGDTLALRPRSPASSGGAQVYCPRDILSTTPSSSPPRFHNFSSCCERSLLTMSSYFISVICSIVPFRKSPFGYHELCREVSRDNGGEGGGIDGVDEYVCECCPGC